MDMGVILVQAYLRVQEYFTPSEYPALEAMRHGEHRMVTDIDLLMVRFPQACQLVPREGRRDVEDTHLFTPDEALGAPPDQIEMIIGEVKIGQLN